MSNQQNKPVQGAMVLYEQAATKILIPLLFVLMTGLLTWMTKVEDRQYALQREAVTEAKLEATERRITAYMDVRLKDLDNKMQLVIRQLELLHIQQQRQIERSQ